MIAASLSALLPAPAVPLALSSTNATAGTDSLTATNPATVMGELWHHFSSHGSSLGSRLLLIVVLSVLVHLLVRFIREFSEWIIQRSHNQKTPLDFVTRQPKFVTFLQLLAATVTFSMYFIALGLVLEELFNLNLAAYLASASIIGLAISFGSQGLVQDVVTSLTLIFSDAMDAGDMVELSGTVVVTGRVEQLGLRFTMLRNFYNQTVFVPNRTIANVSRFTQGGVIAYADIQVPAGADVVKVNEVITGVVKGTWTQFGAIILSEPLIEPAAAAQGGGWEFIRVHFKLWPGQGALIETTFRQQIIHSLKAFDANYAEWQVPITYRAKTISKAV